jgi:aspartate carbamoyltransferase catalytic subunit
MDFTGSHILSVDQFQRQDVQTLFAIADLMAPYANRQRRTDVLQGAVLGNMFFEPSTRTRVSFGSAFNLLGGHVRETAGVDSSALVKGESLHDTAKVLSGYSDVIVMRHWQQGAVSEFARASRVPVINGGDGDGEHPSQALLDLYTIEKELASRGAGIDGLRIALVGDLKYGRAVHSLVKLLALFNTIEFILISPPALALADNIQAYLRQQGHQVQVSGELAASIGTADILYLTRTQEERFASQAEADKYRGLFRLNQTIYTRYCQPNTVIMHPLPRDSRVEANELDRDLDNNPNLAIFRQTDNGVLVRMALFSLLLGVADKVDSYAAPVHWYRGNR